MLAVLAAMHAVAPAASTVHSQKAAAEINAECLKSIDGMVFPGSRWEVRTPESQGVSSRWLKKAVRYLDLKAGGSGASGVAVVRNGYLIWRGSSMDRQHSIDSGTKVFTTAVLGLLMDDGKLTMDTAAAQHFPSLAQASAAYGKMTLRHLATMTSGYDSEKGMLTRSKPWGEPEKYSVPAAPLFEPGGAFKYHDPAVHLLGIVLTRVAGESLRDVFKRRVADPIGMSNWKWTEYRDVNGHLLNNPSGIYEGGILITPLEMARFGHLFLNRGCWDGKPLLDSRWVDDATSNQVPVALPVDGYDLRGRYGYMWWTNGIGPDGRRAWPSAPPRSFVAHGGARNFCWVIPEWSMVVVRMERRVGIKNDAKVWERFFQILKEGVETAASPLKTYPMMDRDPAFNGPVLERARGSLPGGHGAEEWKAKRPLNRFA